MGRIKTKDIKEVSFRIMKRKEFSNTFEKNKEIVNELNVIPEKKMRNKIAGFITRKQKQSKRK